MKKTTMFLLACVLTSHSLFAQTALSKSGIVKKTTAAKKDRDHRLLCDVNFSWMGTTGSPLTYTFSAENVVPGYTYTWYFGDSTSLQDTYATHTFGAPGTYTVCFEAYNEHFNDTCREYVTLCVNEPVTCWAPFNWTTATSTPGIYNFVAENPVSGNTYNWYFGDGKTANGEYATHTYTTAGTYTICLETYTEKSDTCREYVTICVNQVPACWANISVKPGDGTYAFDFEAQSSTGMNVMAYYWDFGDENTSDAGPNVTHEYSDPGVHTVCITVVYENECVARYCMDVLVEDIITMEGEGKTMPVIGHQTLPAKNNGTEKNIKVSPNPAGNNITVRVDAAVNGTYRYNIFSTRGEPTLNGTVSLVKGMQNVALDIKSLRPGKYWIEISNSRQSIRTAFIKL